MLACMLALRDCGEAVAKLSGVFMRQARFRLRKGSLKISAMLLQVKFEISNVNIVSKSLLHLEEGVLMYPRAE